MKRIACTFLALLALALPAAAQEPKAKTPAPDPSGPSIAIPAAVQADPGFILIKATAVDADSLRWFPVGKARLAPQPDFWPQPPLGTFASLTFAPGVYKLGVIPAKTVNGKAAIGEPQFVTVTVGVPAPVPTPPDPKPAPPGPAPVSGMKVLILYDSSAEAAMPKGQQLILRTPEIRDWLNAHTAASAETMSKHAWFIVDKSEDMSATAFAAWMNRPRAGVPWIVVGNDTAVAYEGPLPADTASTIALLSKYAPATRQLRKAG